MAHLVGAKLLIPGDAWRPVQEKPTEATILHFARATRGYPEGRVRIICEDGSDHWWDVAKLPAEWVTALSAQPPASLLALTTPTRLGRRSIATTPATTGRRRSRSRTRTSRAAAGYDSAGTGGVLSDGEGAVDHQRSPAGLNVITAAAVMEAIDAVPNNIVAAGMLSDDGALATGLKRRSRPRRSIRFAPGTVSPGKRAAAAASAIGSPKLKDEVLPAPISAATIAMNVSAPVASQGDYFASPLTSPRSSDGGGALPSPHPYLHPDVGSSRLGCSSVPPKLSLSQRIRNSALILLVMLPAVYFYRQLHFGCSAEQCLRPLEAIWQASDLRVLLTSEFWCALGYQQPLLAVNVVFFLNVDVLFWYISLLQGSTWLIDPFWTIAPVLIGLFYQHHPLAITQPLRSRLSMGLLWLWAVRLTHSYFRREEWRVGAREDWRYARMAHRLGRLRWAVVSFFTVGVTQQLMLVGITLPLFAVHSSAAPWNPVLDTAIFLAAAAGIMTALVADNQLRDFMVENEKREQEGRPRLLLLDTGLWRYSRHPNFFGEQLWWWSLAMWAVVCGQRWMVAGAAFNTLCFVPITQMTEARMLERPERASLYRQYQKTTSVWFPWFKRAVVL